jgi:hypothetical protein
MINKYYYGNLKISKIKNKKIKKIMKIFLLILLFFILSFLSKNFRNKMNTNLINNEIDSIFRKYNKININDIDKKYNPTKQNLNNNIIINNTINIEFTLDPSYILETMLTVASIMATQKRTTKIIFHFGVIKNFTAEMMLKIYNLKEKINNLTEFNFYYLKSSMEKMKNFHIKGEACPGKFELPQLLPDSIEKVLLFDAGDVIVLKDLSELINYDMKNNWVLGLPEPWCIEEFVKDYNITKYINIGSIIINVREFKKNNIWEKYTQNKNIKLGGAVDQTLLNIIIPDSKKDYFPFRLGIYSILPNETSLYDKNYFDQGLKSWLESESNNLPGNPKSLLEYFSQMMDPIFIHQFYGKWYEGKGLSIHRNLVKFFIKLAGIWKELCAKRPGYCN